jgi:hypothetical protein
MCPNSALNKAEKVYQTEGLLLNAMAALRLI